MAVKSLKRSTVKSAPIADNSMLAGYSIHDMELIDTVFVTNNTISTVSFQSIPQDYKHLQLRMTLRTTDSYNSGTYGSLIFNSSGTTYNSHTLWGDGGSVQSSYYNGSIFFERVATNADNGGIFGSIIIDIADYNSSTKNKVTRQIGGYTGNFARQINFKSGLWQSTSPITRIDVSTPTTSLYWVNGCRISLYGIRG